MPTKTKPQEPHPDFPMTDNGPRSSWGTHTILVLGMTPTQYSRPTTTEISPADKMRFRSIEKESLSSRSENGKPKPPKGCPLFPHQSDQWARKIQKYSLSASGRVPARPVRPCLRPAGDQGLRGRHLTPWRRGRRATPSIPGARSAAAGIYASRLAAPSSRRWPKPCPSCGIRRRNRCY